MKHLIKAKARRAKSFKTVRTLYAYSFYDQKALALFHLQKKSSTTIDVLHPKQQMRHNELYIPSHAQCAALVIGYGASTSFRTILLLGHQFHAALLPVVALSSTCGGVAEQM